MVNSLKSYILNESADKSLYEFFSFSGRHKLLCTGLSRKDMEYINVNKINRRYESILKECPSIGTFQVEFNNKCATEIMTRLIRCMVYDLDWHKNIDLIYDEVEDYIYTFFKSSSSEIKAEKSDFLGVECGRKYCVAFSISDDKNSFIALMWD